MSEMKYYEFGVQKDELAKWAKEKGLTIEGMIEWLKAKNFKEYGVPVRFEVFEENDGNPCGYEKEYRMRRAVKGKNYILTGIPIEYLERQAKRHNMTVDQLMKEFRVVANYSDRGNREYLVYRLRRWITYKP
jgi:hypothetical protein